MSDTASAGPRAFDRTKARRIVRTLFLTVIPALLLGLLWYQMSAWYRERTYLREYGRAEAIASNYADRVEAAIDANLARAKSRALGEKSPQYWQVTWIEPPTVTADGQYLRVQLSVSIPYGQSYQVASLVSIDAIVRSAGFAHVDDSVDLCIIDASGHVFYGPDIAGLGPAQAVVRLPGSFWQVLVVPGGGWDAVTRKERTLVQGALALCFSAILAATHIALSRQRLLQQQADADEAARRLSEASFRHLFDSVPEPLLVTDMEGEIIAANKDARDRLSLHSLPATLADVLAAHGVDDAAIARGLLVPNQEIRIRTLSQGDKGSVLAYYDARTTSFSGGDEPERMLILLQDVTEVTLATQSLSASEARYRDLVESSPEGIMLLDVDGCLEMANQQVALMAGYANPSALAHSVRRFSELVDPSQRAVVAEHLALALMGKPVHRLQLDIAVHSGEYLPVEASIAPILERETTTGFCVAMADVTRRERAQRRNRAYRDRLSNLARALGMLIDLYDSDDMMQQIAQTFQDLAGARAVYVDLYDDETRMLTPSAFAGDGEVERILGAYLDAPMLGVAHPMSDGWHSRLLRRGIQRLPGLDGIALGRVPEAQKLAVLQELGDMAVWGVALTRSDATVGAAVMIMDQDRTVPFAEIVEAYAHAVTDQLYRRRTTKAMQESEERYRSLVTNLGDAVILVDSNLRIVEFHDTSSRSLGLNPSEAVGSSYDELLGQLVAQGLTPVLVAAAMGQMVHVYRHEALEWHRGNGDLLCLDAAVFGFRYRDAPHAALVLRDVTDRVRMQRRLREHQRLEDLGRLAAGAAHDLRHIVALIKAEMTVISEAIQRDPERAIEPLATMDRTVFLGENLCSTLVEYGRDLHPNIAPLHMNLALESQCHLMGTLLGSDIELVLDLGPGLILAMADSGLFERVWLNLLVNARDAMRHGGRLTIATRLAELGQDRADDLGIQPGPYAVLSVTDTGPGMTPAQIERAFLPFYSTKETSLAAGLGLAVVHDVIESHGGGIAIDSQEGVGTTFALYFPAISPDEIAEIVDEMEMA